MTHIKRIDEFVDSTRIMHSQRNEMLKKCIDIVKANGGELSVPDDYKEHIGFYDGGDDEGEFHPIDYFTTEGCEMDIDGGDFYSWADLSDSELQLVYEYLLDFEI